MKLLSRVAIVTGSTKGIGRAIALDFAKEGANVVVNGRNAGEAEDVAQRIKAMGGQSLVMVADVTVGKEVNHMVKTTLEKFGQIDILVNNAGGSAREKASLFHNSTEEIWDSVIDRNLKSVMLCARAVIKHMIERRSGNIVSISSTAGFLGEPGLVDYSGAKAGVFGFTKALAQEVGQYGIRVNAVSPGPVEARGLLQMPELLERVKPKIALGRLGKPEEIANLVTFLVSDNASFITGENISISGGYR